MPKRPSVERLLKDARRVLENPFWIAELNTKKCYTRLHDDHDGTRQGNIAIIFSEDGDAHVTINGAPMGGFLRFRTWGGGGRSLRVRNALMILALAIKLDNEKNPNDEK